MNANRLMRSFRNHLISDRGEFVFEPCRSVALPPVPRSDLYIHIPFCKSLCPYCPYNRIRYDETLTAPYLAALLAEIDAYRARLGSVEIGSIYIGGGTPTTMLGEIEQILDYVRQQFTVSGEIAVETGPADLDESTLSRLRSMGVNLLSIGVQSFDDKYLKLLGRNYRSDILEPVLTQAFSAGFDSVNLDLMFALPGQSSEQVIADFDQALQLGCKQLTLYPLFTFPYSSVCRHMELEKVRFPRLRIRRTMYKNIHDHALERGLNRVSVWAFKRGDIPRFSSVTRDFYIGLGAGSGSCLPDMFYFNTFSAPEYIKSCEGQELPVALKMDMSPAMEDAYWLYWRLYDTYVPRPEFEKRFATNQKVQRIIRFARKLGLVDELPTMYALTEKGSFWIHLLQNYYVINYINKIWTKSMNEPWPGRIEL